MKKYTDIKPYLILIALILSTVHSYSKDIAEEGAIIKDSSQHFFKMIKQHPDLIIDHKVRNKFEVYGPTGTISWLKSIGANPLELSDELEYQKAAFGPSYPSPEEIEEQLKEIVSLHSNIMKLHSVGKTSSGRELWSVKVSDQPELDEVEPEVKYIGNMHGNEIVGREMLVRLLRDMGKRYQSGDQQIKKLVDNTEIFIMPSMNPDGADKKRRGNDHWKDLNRNFPDFTTRDDQNDHHGREEETIAVMKWQEARNFSLSANFHGGTKVVNYPWDTTSNKAPLTDLIIDISKEYASVVPGFYDSRQYDDGIVNGNVWYEVDGGMQDWSYYYYNDLQVTIELSHSKWPNYKEMDQYYEDNRVSLISFLERVHQGHGIKTTAQSQIKTVEVIKLNEQGFQESIGTYALRNLEFYKVLPLGDYIYRLTYEDGKQVDKQITITFDKSNLAPQFLQL